MEGLSREEVLAEAQQGSHAEYEDHEFKKAAGLGFAANLFLASIFMVIQLLMKGQISVEMLAVVFPGMAVYYLYEGIKSKVKHKISSGVVWGILALIFVAAFLIRQVG